MKLGNVHILAAALLAGGLGVLASLWLGGSPLLRTDTGQQALQAAMDAAAPEPPPGVKPAKPGEPVPPLELADLQGRIHPLPGAYAGRPLLINVWASWCGPCIEEMPELDRFAAAQGANGTQVVGIALDNAADVRAFLQRTPVAYPIVLDIAGPRDSSVQLGNPKGVLPYSVLIDADGRLRKQKVGPFASGEIDHWAR